MMHDGYLELFSLNLYNYKEDTCWEYNVHVIVCLDLRYSLPPYFCASGQELRKIILVFAQIIPKKYVH